MRRIIDHQSSEADDIEVLFQYETEDVQAVESCVKSMLKGQKYRKYKEVYKVDIDVIKKVIEECVHLKMRMTHILDKAPKQDGGYFIAIH